MNENKLIKILIPVIALVVVFESVMLVSSLDKKTVKNDGLTEEVSKNPESDNKIEAPTPVADFIWETDGLEMKVGKTYNITLNLLSKKDLVLDSVETHIYFDPKLVKVSKLSTNKELGEELLGKVDDKLGSISSILFNEGKVFESKEGETVKVLSFMVTPILEGRAEFELSTSMADKKFATIILETKKDKSSSFLSNKLEINVAK